MPSFFQRATFASDRLSCLQSHLRIIRLHLHTHQEFHTAISFLARDAGFHHQEALGLRSLSAMNLSDAKEHGSRGAMRPPTRPSGPSPLLAPVSKTTREAPARSGRTTAAVDRDARESFGNHIQGHISSWDAPTWYRESLSSSSQPQPRSATSQSYHRYQTRTFRDDQRPPGEDEQAGQWFSGKESSLTAFATEKFCKNASVDVPSQEFSNSLEVGLADKASEPPAQVQALALGRANSLSFSSSHSSPSYSSVSLHDHQWRSSRSIIPVQEEDSLFGEVRKRPSRSSASVEHLARPRSRIAVGSNSLPARTSSSGLFSWPLASLSVASSRRTENRVGPQSDGVKQRLLSLRRSDTDDSNLVALERGRWSPAAVTAGNGAGNGHNTSAPKRPSSSQGGQHDPGAGRQKMRKTVYEARDAQHSVHLATQTQLGSRTLTTTYGNGPGTDQTRDFDQALAPAQVACMRCRRLHSRCDKSLPSCGPCVKAGRVCTYPRLLQTSCLDPSAFEDPNAIEQSAEDGGCLAGVPMVGAEEEDVIAQQAIVQDAPDPASAQETIRNGVDTVDTGTGPMIITSDAMTQTDRPMGLQMDLTRWANLVKSAMELQMDEVAKAARSIEEVDRTGSGISTALLKVARMGSNLAQEIRGLCQASVPEKVVANGRVNRQRIGAGFAASEYDQKS